MAAFSPKSFEPFQCGHHPTFPPNLITGSGSKSIACLLTFGQLFVYFSPFASLALVVSQLLFSWSAVCLHWRLFWLNYLPPKRSAVVASVVAEFPSTLFWGISAIIYLTIFAHIREGHLTAFFWQHCPFARPYFWGHFCAILWGTICRQVFPTFDRKNYHEVIIVLCLNLLTCLWKLCFCFC